MTTEVNNTTELKSKIWMFKSLYRLEFDEYQKIVTDSNNHTQMHYDGCGGAFGRFTSKRIFLQSAAWNKYIQEDSRAIEWLDEDWKTDLVVNHRMREEESIIQGYLEFTTLISEKELWSCCSMREARFWPIETIPAPEKYTRHQKKV